MNAIIAVLFFQSVFGSVKLGSVSVGEAFTPVSLTADCSDQTNGWDPYTFPYDPLEIDAADTQQGDGCLDASAPWPTESLP